MSTKFSLLSLYSSFDFYSFLFPYISVLITICGKSLLKVVIISQLSGKMSSTLHSSPRPLAAEILPISLPLSLFPLSSFPGSHAAKAGLKLTTQQRIALNLWSSFLCLPLLGYRHAPPCPIYQTHMFSVGTLPDQSQTAMSPRLNLSHTHTHTTLIT